jgi:hypothetical protein
MPSISVKKCVVGRSLGATPNPGPPAAPTKPEYGLPFVPNNRAGRRSVTKRRR